MRALARCDIAEAQKHRRCHKLCSCSNWGTAVYYSFNWSSAASSCPFVVFRDKADNKRIAVYRLLYVHVCVWIYVCMRSVHEMSLANCNGYSSRPMYRYSLAWCVVYCLFLSISHAHFLYLHVTYSSMFYSFTVLIYIIIYICYILIYSFIYQIWYIFWYNLIS